MNEKNNHHPPSARLCHVIKRDDFDGYGFNLHAEKGKPGQYIGKVDEGSPAESAGLRQGDRILEVNGEPIGEKTHKQVVEKIKTRTGETKLLVVDPEDENSSAINNKPPNNMDSTMMEPTQQEQQQQHHKEENGRLNLPKSVADMRAMLAAKKKSDPKKESMDFKKKFDIVQKL